MLTTIRQGEGYYIKSSITYDQTPLQKYIELQESICKCLGITIDQLREKTRKREIVIARYICFYIARNNGLGSLKFIGKGLNNFDHSTILHGITLVDDLIQANDKTFLNDWNLCKHLLKSR